MKLDDGGLKSELRNLFEKTQLDNSVLQSEDINYIRETMTKRIRTCKYISPHYMHVDGTSFAAPIVSSVIAQLLELDPSLTPANIRTTLFSTAQRIERLDAVRQGFGCIRPRKAIIKVLKKELISKTNVTPYVNHAKRTIEFYTQAEAASQVSVAGSFNDWAQDVLLMEPGMNSLWKIEIPILPAGLYQYKFFVDEKIWIEDVCNPYREPDGFAGFNSILKIEN